MSDLQAAIDTLTSEGFVAGMKTPQGCFYHRAVNSDDEIAVHVTSQAFPTDRPGVNIWLQDSRNARGKYREDVLFSEADDPQADMLDHIACLEAFAADTTEEAIAIIDRRLGGFYSDSFGSVFPTGGDRAHKDYHRVKGYMDRRRQRPSATTPPFNMGSEVPDLRGKVTPAKMHISSGFQLASVRPGIATYERMVTQATQMILVTHVSNFDPSLMPAALEGEGYLVSLYDEASHGVSFSHRIREDDGSLVDQERAFMLAAAVEASQKPTAVEGARVLANYLTGEDTSDRVEAMAFEMICYEGLGAGAEELFWWQLLDDLHERTYGFSYGVEKFMKMDPEPAPAM